MRPKVGTRKTTTGGETINITNFTQKLFERMSDKYGGDCTINMLRTMNAAYVCHKRKGGCTGVADLSRMTGIPVPTTSRAVANLVAQGWLVEGVDEDDGRRRVINLSKYALSRMSSDWDDCRAWLKE